MAKYYSRTIESGKLPKPPVAPLTGLQLMKGARAQAVHRAQDNVVGLSKRPIFRCTLQGNSWLVPNTDPTDAAPATRTHPDATTWRTVGRPYCELTPGCVLRLSVVAVPSGQTQQSDGAAGFEPSGAFGKVRVNLTWTDADGGTDTTSHEVSISASNQTYAATRTGSGDSWTDSIFQRSALIYPDGLTNQVTVLRQWTRPPVTVSGTIDHLGGTRAVDVCLWEVPFACALEADDSADEWVNHIWDSGGPFLPNLTWPEQHKIDPVDGDPRGIHRMIEVHEAQRDRLGPMLFSWSAWKEDDADPTSIAEGYQEISSTTWIHLTDTNITTYSEDAPGFSMSGAAVARNQSDNGAWVYRDGAGNETTASVPMVVRIYGCVESGSSGGTLRLRGKNVYADLTITNTSPGWTTFYCHMECGLGPEQPRIVVPLLKSLTASKYVRIYYLVAYVARTAPAA